MAGLSFGLNGCQNVSKILIALRGCIWLRAQFIDLTRGVLREACGFRLCDSSPYPLTASPRRHGLEPGEGKIAEGEDDGLVHDGRYDTGGSIFETFYPLDSATSHKSMTVEDDAGFLLRGEIFVQNAILRCIIGVGALPGSRHEGIAHEQVGPYDRQEEAGREI